MTETERAESKKFRRRADARPDEVLDAALDLFAQKGFAATRVDDIAARAGISKGAVYLYFQSKEAILEGIVRRAVAPIADHALEIVADYDGDPRFAVSMVIKLVAGRLRDPKIFAIPRLIIREVGNFPDLAVIYRREVLDRVIPVIEGLVRRGIERGYLRQVDPNLTIRSIVGPLVLHVLMAEIFGIMPPDGLAIDRLIDNHLTILFDGLSAPAGATQWTSS